MANSKKTTRASEKHDLTKKLPAKGRGGGII